MTTHTDFAAALAASPRDAALWGIASDWHEEHGTTRPCPKCEEDGQIVHFNRGPGAAYNYRSCSLCHGSGEFSEATYCRLMATVLPWEPGNEAWHGEMNCSDELKVLVAAGSERSVFKDYALRNRCSEAMGISYLNCNTCNQTGKRHTFALLYDHPGDGICRSCNGRKSNRLQDWRKPLRPSGRPATKTIHCSACKGSGKAIIPGHHRVLVADLRSLGLEEMAERVLDVQVVQANGIYGVLPAIVDANGGGIAYTTYPDACREACRRIWEAMTEPCSRCQEPFYYPAGCPDCLGLSWRLRL